MKVDDNSKVQQMLEYQMMAQILKEMAGSSDSFALVMQSLTNSMKDSSGNVDLSSLGLGQSDLSKLGISGGERLGNIYNDIKTDVGNGNIGIEEAITNASRKYGVDGSLINAVIKQESNFNNSSVSAAGAQGLMQLMPGTAKELGVANSFNESENVNGGTKYLKSLLNMYGNSKELALAAYNAGPGTLANRGVHTIADISKLPSETRNYVTKVMQYYGKQK